MKYEVYCDESCIEAIFDKDAHKYIGIGGVWIPAEYRSELKASINSIKSEYNIKGEIKWNKVSPNHLDAYKQIIKCFFDTDKIRFRVILIDSSKVNNEVYNESSGELGFYKFYYQLICHWLYSGNEYSIFIDHKVNGYRHRVQELNKILQHTTNAQVHFVQALPSEQSIAIQMADLLTGVVTAKFNNNTTSEAKKELICFVESFLGREIAETRRNEIKFNIFNINLRQGW